MYIKKENEKAVENFVFEAIRFLRGGTSCAKFVQIVDNSTVKGFGFLYCSVTIYVEKKIFHYPSYTEERYFIYVDNLKLSSDLLCLKNVFQEIKNIYEAQKRESEERKLNDANTWLMERIGQ